MQVTSGEACYGVRERSGCFQGEKWQILGREKATFFLKKVYSIAYSLTPRAWRSIRRCIEERMA